MEKQRRFFGVVGWIDFGFKIKQDCLRIVLPNASNKLLSVLWAKRKDRCVVFILLWIFFLVNMSTSSILSLLGEILDMKMVS